jgi:cytochrome c2
MINRTTDMSAVDRPARRLALSLGLALCLTLSVGALPAQAATQASTAATSKVAVVTFKNCAALNAKHPGGVAKVGVKFNIVNGKKRAFAKRPTFSNALYAANKKSDRDRDGIACER